MILGRSRRLKGEKVGHEKNGQRKNKFHKKIVWDGNENIKKAPKNTNKQKNPN